ncbi:Daunorubicin/doxorubicin resistance ATP-binding protein DrrA [Corynebacterium kalinowskii]|uniref:Daunorubicin/doxorubicin resistance ATP-binding protein DrrA n=1 Tax=Corynebacterium kalinowskii TaxID=2675216 RepID=A0A6B8VTI9_9CORY|nr:ABC transporter ATP-binding protein [Corynebacterium kalinowskii]QGU02066.1 Daunorubicin/doxorubicin resistance ATP-binding protein DrrA [Corynebacterium kalinowskii]
MNALDSALSVRNVSKSFGDKVAVTGLSFDVPAASVLALLGPNGAGKTTTIEMCEGFQKPDSGEIRVLGLDPTRAPGQVRERIGIMLQGGGAYPGVRVEEMLRLTASYSADPHDVDWLLELVGLEAQRRTPYRRLSGGQQQRLSLAQALVGKPELMFLDEPTAGMDAQSRLLVWDLIDRLRADGVTVILTTHLMDEAEALADQVVIVDHGALVAAGTPAELMKRGSEVSHIHVSTSSALDLSAVELPGEAIRPLTYRFQAPATPESISQIVSAAAAQNVLIRSLEVDKASLEEVFLDITGRKMRT